MKQFNFATISELSRWLNESGLNLRDVTVLTHDAPVVTSGYAQVEGTPIQNTTTTETAGIGINQAVDATIIPESTMPKNVAIKSVSVQPKIKQVPLSESGESENVWYVDEYESVEDACCGTSKIVYKGSSIFMNVCESEGKSTVTLVAEVDGNIVRLPFILDTYCNNTTEYDMILSI